MSDLQIFLKLDGIDGESTVKGHAKEIDVLAYEQEIDIAAIHSAEGGTAAGRATFSGVRFRKNVDAASIPMLVACASGKHIKSARFTFRRVASGFEFYKVTLDEVLITHMVQRAGTGEQYPLSFDSMNAGAPNDGFLDDVRLDYGKIHWEYHRPAGAPITGGWDVVANVKL